MKRSMLLVLWVSCVFVLLGMTPMPSQNNEINSSVKFAVVYGPNATFEPLTSVQEGLALRDYVVRRQLNDSNCDYIAASNGIANIGGDGEAAFWLTRQLVPQDDRDFREVYHTKLGPNGSDQPFTPDNLGTAPEAFVGVYEAMGYNVVSMSAPPGSARLDFVQALRDRLFTAPGASFAHIWIVTGDYNPQARIFTVAETGEQVSLPYPYHEVTLMADPTQPEGLVVLDGLVGYPYVIGLAELAGLMQPFNRVVVVQRNDGGLAEHQRFQVSQMGQPFVDHPLGAGFLRAARAFWGPDYRTWGTPIGLPLRMNVGSTNKVVLFSDYVQYERVHAGSVTLAPLGQHKALELVGSGVLSQTEVMGEDAPPLPEGMRFWVEAHFGSVEQFHHVFGRPITGELWLSAETMEQAILRGWSFAPLQPAVDEGYVVVFTEAALLGWHPNHGTFVVPLGRVFYQQLLEQLASGEHVNW
ncbi:MAG: hypothetical protein HC837_09080 [Chloroflexaceae bacterium]|nr:hypothetical protein [Chloroflexaceae bacterium]